MDKKEKQLNTKIDDLYLENEELKRCIHDLLKKEDDKDKIC